jgi:hypothetical protein
MGKNKFRHIAYVDHKSTRCPVSGKVQHPSRTAAEDHLAYIGKTRGEDTQMDVYLCAYCHTWHFGHSRERK